MLLLATSLLLCICTALAKIQLTIHVIFPYPNDDPLLHPSWYDGPQLFTAASLAAEHINSDPSLLRDYELRLVEGDGGCDITTKAAEAVVSALTDTNRVVGVIGPGCSASTLLATPVTSRQEVALINVHTAGSPLLANSNLYPFGISIYGSTVSFVNTTLALMELANWTRVAVFYEEARPYFSTTYDLLSQRVRQMENNSLDLAIQTAVSNLHLPLQTIVEEKVRIVYVLAGPDLSSKIMCMAHNMSLTNPNQQWVFFGRDLSDFKRRVSFVYKSTNYTCSEETMLKAMERNMIINFKLTPFKEEFGMQTVAGITYNQFNDVYEKRLQESGYDMNIWGTLAYDAVWSLALCLNSTEHLSDYCHGQYNITKLIRECFNALNFSGVSGDIQFDPQTGFADRAVDVHQVINGSDIYSAYFKQNCLKNLTQLTVLNDTVEFEIEEVKLYTIDIAFVIVTALLLLLIVICHILTVVYRKHPSVKAASPNIAHFTYTGCYLLVSSMLYYVISIIFIDARYEPDAWHCRVSFSFFFPIGLTLILGSVLVRTWRLYRIFFHTFQPGNNLSDDSLIAIIFFMVGIDVAIAIMWMWLDPLHEEDLSFENGIKIEVYVICDSDWYSLWFGVIFVYKFIEVLPVLVLSMMTHSIRDKEFSTKQVGAYVFITSLMILIMAPLYCISSFVRNDKVWLTLNTVLLCLLLSLILLFSLAMLFVRPLLPVFKELICHERDNKRSEILREV